MRVRVEDEGEGEREGMGEGEDSCPPDKGEEEDAGGSVDGPDDFMRASRSKKKSSRTKRDSKKTSHVLS